MDKKTYPKIVVRSLGNGRFSWRLLGSGPGDTAAWGFTESEALAHTLAETTRDHYLAQRRRGR